MRTYIKTQYPPIIPLGYKEQSAMLIFNRVWELWSVNVNLHRESTI